MYLATPAAAERVGSQIYHGACETAPWVAVDVRALDVQHINPDEDCFFVSWICDEPVGLRDLADPQETVRDEDCLLHEQRMTMDWQAFAARPYASYGAWAEAVGLGDDTAMTEQAWLEVGSLDYRGPVAAAALRAATVTAAGQVGLLSSVQPGV